MAHTIWELKQKQSLPLEAKIEMTKNRIRAWHEYFDSNVYVSFSGGKDSTVLLDIARQLYPDIEAVFVDTGLEYPEIRQFVKTFDNVSILRPSMSFKDVIIKYGYPFISKEVGLMFDYSQSDWVINKFEGLNKDGTVSAFRQRYVKYTKLLNSSIKLTSKCCNIMKKDPLKIIEKFKRPVTGTIAEESKQREQSWLKTGCNSFESTRKSNPMAFWTEQDILSYIKQYNLPYASVYGELQETDEQGNLMLNGCGKCLRFSGCQRTGCVFCGFGAHLDTLKGGISRFIRLKQSHPKLYDYCMNGGEFVNGIWQPNDKGLGMAYVIDELNRLYSKTLKNGRVKKFIQYE